MDLLDARQVPDNREAAVPLYGGSDVPTRPSTVTPETKLEDLNLNWRESELRERERTKHVHRLHPYLGKYIPQLVEIFLRNTFVPLKRSSTPSPVRGRRWFKLTN